MIDTQRDDRTTMIDTQPDDRTTIPLATVSGVASTNPAMIDWFARTTPVRYITSKSIQCAPNPGNREPVITEPLPGSFGNAVGLRNPGLVHAREEFAALLQLRDAWPPDTRLIISLAGSSGAEFAALTAALAPYADLIELNLSCPHAHGGYGTAIGCNPNLVAESVAAAVAAANDVLPGGVPILAKLTPNTNAPGAIARRAIDAGAAGIVAINTVGPVQYREPHSGRPILTNPAPAGASSQEREALTGRGGQSGRWVFARAVECIAEIRAAIGSEPLVIGMGGVATDTDARALRAAGADVIGVGSALAAYHQSHWPALLSWIGGDRPERGAPPALPVTAPVGEAAPATRAEATRAVVHPVAAPVGEAAPATRMSFVPYTVHERRECGGELFELELDGPLPFAPGQTVFLWLPGVGEKPFSPACATPATFLIGRRGPLTRALGALTAGDTVYVRGPYGSGAGVIDRAPEAGQRAGERASAAVLVAGSGIALAPMLARVLDQRGFTVEVWAGLRDETHQLPLAKAIQSHARYLPVHDQGTVGRVLSQCADTLAESAEIYIVGPTPFMRAAIDTATRVGVPLDRIAISTEQTMLCGVGLCGACQVGGLLTCSHGTFVPAAQWIPAAQWNPDARSDGGSSDSSANASGNAPRHATNDAEEDRNGMY